MTIPSLQQQQQQFHSIKPQTANINMNFGAVFAKTLSSVQSEREDAQRQLEKAATENFAGYLGCLSQELGNEQQQFSIRTAAGLALKNALTARDSTRKDMLQNQWRAIDATVRGQIKHNVLRTLASNELRAATTAAQVISAIAAAELPVQSWNELIPTLLENVTNPQSPANLKQSTLQAIGFLCEEIPLEVLESQSNNILTAVIQGARKEEQNNAVRLAAVTALVNSLEFAKNNFEKAKERDFIMQVVCEATTAPDTSIVIAAFECLVKAMQLYYDHMAPYMEAALFPLTINGMRNSEEKIVLQSIEFWSTICDEEMYLLEEAEEAAEYGESPERNCLNFSKAAVSNVVPLLLWLLTKQEEDADEDEWNPAMAAATCLSLFAQCVRDDVVGPVVPFVETNIQSQDWHHREASVMAFGSILDGPSSDVLQPLVSQALPVLIQMTQDSSVLVKDTAAWTLGRICDYHVVCINVELHLQNLIGALLRGLEDSPRVAANCCWALMNLSDQMGSDDNENASYPLSMFYEHIVVGLLKCADRSDASEANLRTSAYEALSSLLQKSAMDCVPVVQKMTAAVLERLEQSIVMEKQLVGSDDRNQHAELQAALCGTVQSLARRLGSEIQPFADRIMSAFFQIFTSSSKTATVVEDVFLAIGVIIGALESNFSRYMDAFAPFLMAALQNHQEYQLCNIAVGLVGDLSRSLNDLILPYCDQFMTLLFQNLRSDVLHRDVKPPILSCFGDLALAIQSKYEKYLATTMSVLQQACQVQPSPNDLDLVDYVNVLREGILEAFTGIFQGFRADGKSDLLLPYVEEIIKFLNLIYNDAEKTEAVARGAVGLLGDIAISLGKLVKPLLSYEWVESFIKQARTNRNYSVSTKEVAKWAKTVVKTATS